MHPARLTALLAVLLGAVTLGAHGLGLPAAARVVTVRLQGNEFVPKEPHVHVGDTLRFVNGNGGPHNMAFAIDSIPAAAKDLLAKAMGGEKLGPVSSPLLLDPAEAYAFVVPKLVAGRYPLYCVPHMANMRGALVVEP